MSTPEPVLEPPYGATPLGVRALVRDVASEGTRIGQPAARVSDEQVEAWIWQGAGVVTARLWRLPGLPLSSTTGLSRATASPAVRQLVELWAAALLSDVTHPERSGDDRYGAVLLDRFYKLLDDLAGSIEASLATGDAGEETGTDADEGLAGYCFPDPPLFTRTMGF